MRLIQNSNVAFRCPNTLKEKLEAFAAQEDVHVAVVIRAACVAYLKQEAPDFFWSPQDSAAGNQGGNGWLVK